MSAIMEEIVERPLPPHPGEAELMDLDRQIRKADDVLDRMRTAERELRSHRAALAARQNEIMMQRGNRK